MLWLGMWALGAFVGYVISYGLIRTTDWSKFAANINPALSAAVAGAIQIINMMGPGREAWPLYAIGLGYGALCTNLRWVTDQHASRGQSAFAILHVIASAVATVILAAILFWPAFRDYVLPH